jgi:hypothetical protein
MDSDLEKEVYGENVCKREWNGNLTDTRVTVDV